MTETARLAGFATRFVALAIDVVVVNLVAILIGVGVAIVGQVLSLDTGGDFSATEAVLAGAAWMVLAGAYLLVFWTFSGQTPGMDFMGLRVIAANGGRVSLPRALRRLAGVYACVLTFGAGFLLILVDERRRGLHDRTAGTLVIHDPGAGRGRTPWGARQA